MTKQEIEEKIADINSEIDELVNERDSLQQKLECDNEWSKEEVTKRLRSIINIKYGSGHKIKVAMLKVNSEYNDEYYEYSPTLVLIDSSFNEVEHNIDADAFVPSYDVRRDYYEEHDEELVAEDITIKF